MNANTYTRIGRDDFEHTLATCGDFEAVRVAGTKELVYDAPTAHDDIVVRVLSTLDARSGGSARDSGADAIRVMAFDTAAGRPIDMATRTHRIQTWAKNLTPKIDAMFDAADEAAAERAEADSAFSTAFENAMDALATESGADDEIVVADLVETRFGKKLGLDSPFAAKDAIKSLEWDTAHPSWDADAKKWRIDADAVEYAAEHLADEGWTLVAPAVADEADDEDEDAVDFAAIEAGDVVDVTYTAKTTGTEKTVAGTVTRTAEDAFAFTRENDDHRMSVVGDELRTSGSYYPFVGTVTGVETR